MDEPENTQIDLTSQPESDEPAEEEILPGEETPTEAEAIPALAEEPKKESRLRNTLRIVLRVALIIFIVIGIGALLAIFTLYIPERQRAADNQQNLVQANQKVDELQAQIGELEKQLQNQQDSYSALEAQNQELQSETDQAELHVVLLSVRTDVANARLAILTEDTNKALLILERTPDTLDKMESLLEPEQHDRATMLRDRLELVLSEIETDAYAAESDLDVLEKTLLEFENDYFAQP